MCILRKRHCIPSHRLGLITDWSNAWIINQTYAGSRHVKNSRWCDDMFAHLATVLCLMAPWCSRSWWRPAGTIFLFLPSLKAKATCRCSTYLSLSPAVVRAQAHGDYLYRCWTFIQRYRHRSFCWAGWLKTNRTIWTSMRFHQTHLSLC